MSTETVLRDLRTLAADMRANGVLSGLAVVNASIKEIERLCGLFNTPHTDEFLKAVELEALHQRERWAAEHDAGKTDADWFWLIGYLAGKALNKPEKQLHHIITTAAACLNWHAGKTGTDTRMRPGTDQS